MQRLVIGVLVGLAVGSPVTLAQESSRHVPTPRQAAKALAVDYLAPLVRPDARRVTVSGSLCADVGRKGFWYSCHIVVTGQTTCHATVRVLEPHSAEYTGWIPRMRCR